MIQGMLVIIPCGAGKIWDKNPHHGMCLAKDTYTGSPFRVNRKYAEKFGEKWMILSAKYGYIEPEFVIPGDYNVTFKDPRTNPVAVPALIQQIQEVGLNRFPQVIGLGGIEYRDRIRDSFKPYNISVQFPFADLGLRIGETMSLIKKSVDQGMPFPK